jgi:hypothetical protein
VFVWILQGACEHDIQEAIAATWPDREARPLITAAMSRIMASADADAGMLRGWCLEATRSIYQQAIAVNDHQTALRGVKQMMEIASCGASKKAPRQNPTKPASSSGSAKPRRPLPPG